jgi:glyoxylase-like metal-dependent hydrolase (beta-lactamase superfamily II)
MKTPDVIVKGKDNGEGMVVHYKTARGTDIFGLGVPNIYIDADWDLGPTWCYLISGPKTTLIDTGRLGKFDVFGSLLKSTGKTFSDINRIVITHSHEDHDGNVADIISAAPAELLAHTIYRHMISYHPDVMDGAVHPELPGSCRVCRMPEAFYSQNCIPYHKARSVLTIDIAVTDGYELPDEDLRFVFTPGHSPDSLCLVLENEVIFTGDTLLPDITSQPSLANAFEINRRILPEEYRRTNDIYGLMNYVRSLSKIAKLRHQPFKATFPAHRFFYNGRFNLLDSRRRAREIIRFHINRCRDILKIIDSKPTNIKDIVVRHFPPSRLDGIGKSMADNEVRAHLEIMEECGDIIWGRAGKDIIERTGTSRCLDKINLYL